MYLFNLIFLLTLSYICFGSEKQRHGKHIHHSIRVPILPRLYLQLVAPSIGCIFNWLHLQLVTPLIGYPSIGCIFNWLHLQLVAPSIGYTFIGCIFNGCTFNWYHLQLVTSTIGYTINSWHLINFLHLRLIGCTFD